MGPGIVLADCKKEGFDENVLRRSYERFFLNILVYLRKKKISE